MKHKVIATTLRLKRFMITPPLFVKIARIPKSFGSPTEQAQASLMPSIPNYPPSRQGKSLDNTGKHTSRSPYGTPYIYYESTRSSEISGPDPPVNQKCTSCAPSTLKCPHFRELQNVRILRKVTSFRI